MSPAPQARRGGALAVALCAAAAVFEGFDLQAPGVTAPVLAPLFGMSPDERGLFLSMSTFGLMFGAIIGGRLSDRIGRKWVLIGSVTIFSILSIATALATSAAFLFWARFLTGIGLGGALPTLIALAAESVSPQRRNTAVGLLLAAPPIGGALASFVSAAASGPQQWPLVYYVGGVAPLVLVVPLLIAFLPNHQPAATTSAAAGGLQGLARALFGEGRAPRTVSLWLGFLCVLLVLFMLLGWLPSLMVSRGLGRADASLVQIAFNLFAIPGSLLAGTLLDRARRPALAIGVIFVAAGAALAFLASAPGSLGWSILAGGLVGAAVTGAQTTLYALAPNAYPQAIRGVGVGFCVAVGRFGSAAGPLLAGNLVHAGQAPSQVILTLLPILAVAGLAAAFVAWSGKRLVAAQPA